MKRFESKIQKDLFYWVEPVGLNINGFHVVAQAEGYPATEAYDDWFKYKKDAEEIAEKLSRGENIV